nr:hypothetical protein [uncultured Rhodopila sp.]
MSVEGKILKYVKQEAAELGDEPLPTLFVALREAETHAEVRALGHALLCRIYALSDPPYRIGGERCDPRLTEIAAGLGWTA